MKILVLANFGMGLYRFRKEILQEVINQGYEVFVSLPNDDYVKLLENIGCKYIESKVDRRGTNPISDIKLLSSYMKIINNIKPDIVLTYTIKPNIYGGLASAITNTPYLSNVTGLGTAVENKGLIQKISLILYKIGLRNAKSVFFQNEANRNSFLDKKIVNSNAKIIPGSGVNLEQHRFEEYPEDEGAIKFLFIGRVMKAKGIDELLAAIKQTKQLYSNVEFHIVGFCEEDNLDQLKGLDNDGLIYYHGQQKNVHNFIKEANAIILPSYHEGRSNVLLESASTGRPILASNISGCKETFDEGISGFGFQAKNVDSLVQAIIKFIELPHSKKKEMGLAGRKKMEKEYDRNIVIEAYMEEINKLNKYKESEERSTQIKGARR